MNENTIRIISVTVYDRELESGLKIKKGIKRVEPLHKMRFRGYKKYIKKEQLQEFKSYMKEISDARWGVDTVIDISYAEIDDNIETK